MRQAARKPPAIDLEVGGSVDAYLVADFVPRRGAAELICEAIGPDGDAVNLVMAWSTPPDKQAWASFRELARTRATLHHEALLPVRSVGDHRGRPYLAMDPYPETSFEELLEGAPLPAGQVLPLLAPVCHALDLAHANGLVHQSLSGASLLMDGDAVLLDGFGVAGGSRELTFWSVGVLEARYCSPEELQGAPLGPASNVYSLTALLVHALTGSSPYEGAPAGQTFAHMTEPPPRPSEHMPQLGGAFDDVIARGMAKDPAERPASAWELLAEAASALGVDLPARPESRADEEAEVSLPAPVRTGRIPNAFPRVAVAAALVVVSVAGLAAGVVLDPFDGDGASAAEPNVTARALERLDDQRTALRAELLASETPQEQAATAAELAATYDRAADAADSPQLVSATRAAERAYEELGAAADAGDAGRFAAASDAVARADARLGAVADAPR